MRELKIGERILTDSDVYVIAELASNHMGDVAICEAMIKEAAKAGADAVKLQKRNNREMFTKTMLVKPYQNELSYGSTYGEHREHLDWFGKKEFEAFKMLAKKHGLDFIVTPFDPESVAFLTDLGIDAWKIASSDVKNIPLIRYVASIGGPVIFSTGGATERDIDRVVEAIDPINTNYAILYCVSIYPNTDECLNLRYIDTLKKSYGNALVGFSSHHPGLQPCNLARAQGASVFEVHFTLNRGWKGTDHGFSLEPRGLETLCQDLKRVETMLGKPYRVITEEETKGFVSKMGKGLYLRCPLAAGSVIKPDDIVIKSPYAGGFQPYEQNEAVGGVLVADCATGVNIGKEWLK